MRFAFWLALLCALHSMAPAQPLAGIKVPAGKPALVDGRWDEGEWNDAATADLGGSARLYVGARNTTPAGWMVLDLGEEE